jgi:glutamyl-tRNA synthetase
MAPSPTGKFHIGGLRTTLFNYFFARQNGGKFIVRSEDTDTERSKKEFEDNMLEALSWLGIEHDEFCRQSERTDIYVEHIQKLIDGAFAYEGEDSSSGDGKVIRFKNPNIDVTFHDLVLGDITFNTEELGDFVIARTMHAPLYHLTVVVDDALSGVTHVVRGQDHISNTARQILILEACGFERPKYAHIPLILSEGGGKMSKRDPNVYPVTDYREMGILPDALINFMSMIGWNPGDEREIFTKEELVQEFSLERVQKKGAVYNIQKLFWINKEHLKKLSNTELDTYFKKFLPEQISEGLYTKLRELLLERVSYGAEIQKMAEEGEFEYYLNDPTIENTEAVVWKKGTKEDATRHLSWLLETFKGASDAQFDSQDGVQALVWDYAETEGKGDVLWPLRYTLTGKDRSPAPFFVAHVIGREATIRRIEAVLSIL